MNPSRRDLLRFAGGLVLALHLPGCGRSSEAPPAPGTPPARPGTAFEPNAWLRIYPDDRIVFVLDRVEMGQGTMTSHPMIMAEELEVDPQRIEIVFAGVDPVYGVRLPHFRGAQTTAGSASVLSSWDPLRVAGATAREMLRRAAAAEWSVPLEECDARDGTIRHAPSGRTATYGALATRAAAFPVEEPRLKEPHEFRLLGKSIRRLDGPVKTNGSAVYGLDVKLPGLVVAVVIHPPVHDGRVASFDAAVARTRPGVLDVFPLELAPTGPIAGVPGQLDLRPQGIAVVAATYWQARRASEDVRVTWEGGRTGTSSESILAHYRDLSSRPGTVQSAVGDVDAELGRAAATLEATYETPFLAHAGLEPTNATAIVTGERCEIWVPTQAPGWMQATAAQVLGRPAPSIQVHGTMIGGAFGRRTRPEEVTEAVLIAQRIGRPVKVVWSREDEMANDYYRPMAVSSMRGGLDATGMLRAWLCRLACQVGPIVPGLDTEAFTNTLYAIAATRVEGCVAESIVRCGAWRSVALSSNTFAFECFLDELAHLGGRDPVEFRRPLLRDAPRALGVLELAASKAGWGSPLPAGTGRGIALQSRADSHCAQVVEAEVNGTDVRVRRVVAAIDCGLPIHPDLIRAQIEGSIVFGLGAALHGQITFREGQVQQSNFDDFRVLRYHECPAIEVHVVDNTERPSGSGEVGVAPIAPALCNAIFAASGRRIRRLPIALAMKEAP
ncbi:molybdopterin-dependent oxidoreductase [Pendulispora brunnea]|uniref:Molybdopterin-dependent oxidoreductase n=1 Tax=Pendulispora brunnea TaxID=2905690 RepID=A0ABZ2K1E1_9BACT